jgi:hypothetical protein
MPHVEYTGDIGGWDDNGITLSVAGFICCKKMIFLPVAVPAFFNLPGFIPFID